MTTIDHAGALAVSRPQTLPDEHVAARALQVARRTARGNLGDGEAAADMAQDVAITAVRRAGSLRDPAALDAWVHRIAVRAALREARRAGRRRAAERAGHYPPPAAPDDDLAGSLALLDGLPGRQRLGAPGAVALVAAAAAVIGAIAALPGGESPSRPQNAHGILQAAAAVAAEQPVPADDRYTRALDRFVYDGDYRYGDGPLARVPFAAIPRDAASAARLLEAAIRDGRWMPENNAHPRWAPGVVEAEVARSAVQLLAMGNLDGSQRQALFGLLGSRPGARSLGEITDAAGRKGVGVTLRLPDFGDELRVIIDPETSDILQSTEVMAPPPANPPRLPAGVRKPPWPAPVGLAERTQVFLSTGSVAALGARP